MISTEAKQQALGVAYEQGVLDVLGIVWKNPTNKTLSAVARQYTALADGNDAQRYAAQMRKEDPEAYYKVIEIQV